MNPRPERPPAVTAIAAYEWLRAAVLLLITLDLLLSPRLRLAPSKSLRFLTYVTAGHNLSPVPLAFLLLPVFALYLSAVGAGLWRLQGWARNLVMVTSGVTVVLWIRYLAFSAILHNGILKTHLQRDAVLILVTLDTVVFCQLAFSPGVAQSFRRSSSRPRI